MKVTAQNSAHLAAQLDRFNAGRPHEKQVVVNWGKERSRGTWYAHGAYGRDLKTGLTFDEVRDYVQDAINLDVKYDTSF